jgi:hypothetical protein
MIKETDNMSTTNHKLLKQCKLKFSNCYQLNHGVANIPVFVDKFLNRLAFGRITFETMYHLSGQMMLLSIVAAGIGICREIAQGRMLGEVLPFYIASFLGLYLYFSVSSVVDIRGKKRILKINLIDYLENHLSSRIGVTQKDMEMLYGDNHTIDSKHTSKAGIKRTVELMPLGNRNIAYTENTSQESKNNLEESNTLVEELRREVKKAVETPINNNTKSFTKEQENELEELLKEFLTT